MRWMTLPQTLVAFGLLLGGATVGAQTVPAETGSSIGATAAQAALDLHNRARRDVGTAPLAWSAELADFAQKWADHLAKDEGCRMQHRPRSGPWGSKYGENIFWGSAASFSPKDAANSWYGEIKDFKPGILTGDNWYKTGHYTQMVWKNTTHVGMGQAVCPNGAIIIVGNYNPPGNYMGQSPY